MTNILMKIIKPDNKVLSGFAFKNVENDYVDVS